MKILTGVAILALAGCSSPPPWRASDYVCYKFVPQRDITTYELAQIVAKRGGGMFGGNEKTSFTPKDYDMLALDLKRHFQEPCQ
jgi:hypothetical protein